MHRNDVNILVIGAHGQLGTVLTDALQHRYGMDQVLASDVKERPGFEGRFQLLDATDYQKLKGIVTKNQITEIYHLAAVLSANGEKNPIASWDLNMTMLLNVLEVSRIHGVKKVFCPSSIAVFGDGIDKYNCVQNAPLIPTTVYGISKAAGENWGQYYFDKYGLDVRSLRYPGVIGYQSQPGGGTTDYAIDIFYKAIKEGSFNCFLAEHTALPMIYMDDAIRATIELMESDRDNIQVGTSYNLAGMTFTPKELFEEIQKHFPEFTINYLPDFRQEIAASWPAIINDKEARVQWAWKPQFDLAELVKDMIQNIESKELQLA